MTLSCRATSVERNPSFAAPPSHFRDVGRFVGLRWRNPLG
jgi:hypothetical protein